MDTKEKLKLIAELSEANGAPGFEDEVAKAILRHSEGIGSATEDRMRNVFISRAENSGKKPVIQLDAHSDEVAFMVHSINSDGTMKFIALGGWVASCIPAHPVRVLNADGIYIPGIVASKPPHYMSDAEKSQQPKIENMVIDIGAASRAEVEKEFKVGIAAPIVPDVPFRYLEEAGILYGKAFDCRLGCAALLAVLQELKGENLDVDIVGALAVQEEVGLRGARVTANAIKPQAAIIFEGTPADDTMNGSYNPQTALKKGPMLRHIDAGMITNHRYQRFALDLAERTGIPVQEAVRTGGSTNGASIHLANQGVPSIVIGIPVRYIHTHYCFAALSDWENSVKLGVEILKALNEEVLNSL